MAQILASAADSYSDTQDTAWPTKTEGSPLDHVLSQLYPLYIFTNPAN
jgi:hypothetical protein